MNPCGGAIFEMVSKVKPRYLIESASVFESSQCFWPMIQLYLPHSLQGSFLQQMVAKQGVWVVSEEKNGWLENGGN